MKTIQNQNRNGRPTKSAAEKKGYMVRLKMATEEYFALKSKAEQLERARRNSEEASKLMEEMERIR